MKRILAALCFAGALCAPAAAQQYHDAGGTVVPGVVVLTGCSPTGNCTGQYNGGGGGGGSTVGFTPTPAFASLAGGDTSARVGLPSNAGTVLIENQTANPACVVLGNTSVTAASNGSGLCTTGDFVGPYGVIAYFPSGAQVDAAAIDATTGSATTILLSGGSGVPTGWGGGAGGGGASFPSCCTTSQPGIVAPNTGAHFIVDMGTGWNVPIVATGGTPLLLNGLSTTVTAIKASPGTITSVYCYNPSSAVAYIQLFNVAAGSVTLGSTAPVQSYGVPPTNASGIALPVSGINFSTAISAAMTTTATGSTAPTPASDCNVTYN